jgi:uncharacterized GH25 family protein
MQTKKSFIKLEAETFNAYLKDQGLDEVVALRKKKEQVADSAREYYSRYSKLLVQAGAGSDDTYKKIVGLPVEIIPIENPYTLKVGDRIHFQVLFNGSPLFGAQVKIFNRNKGLTTIQKIYTQQDGTIETTVSNNGNWLVSVIKMVPSKDARADWESYWGSLVFGI